MITSDEFHLIRKKILLYLFIKELHCIVGEYPGVPLKTILHLLLPVSLSVQDVGSRLPSVVLSSCLKSVLAYLGLSSTVPRIELVTEVYALSLLYWTGAGRRGKWEGLIGRRGGGATGVTPDREGRLKETKILAQTCLSDLQSRRLIFSPIA